MTELHQTWTKLGNNEALADGQPSLLLDLADDLETNYNHQNYTLLLPAINISDPAQREEARQYLLDNPPYRPFDCRVEDPDASNLITCQILVELSKLQQFYRYVYLEILGAETVPTKYDEVNISRLFDDDGGRFDLTIDTTEKRPVRLVISPAPKSWR